MQKHADMELALRVLAASVDHLEPDPKDVEELLRLVPPHAAAWPADEMACEVIQRGVKRLRKAAAKA